MDIYNIDEDRSITITSGVSMLMHVASGEQDHMSSGVSVLTCVAGDVGGAYKHVEFGEASGLACVLAYPLLQLWVGHTCVWLEEDQGLAK